MGGQARLGMASGMGGGGDSLGAGQTKKIFVGGLAHETNESDFISYFGLFGQVVDCVIMCDPYTRKPRGFGFVTYDSTAAVDRACVSKFHDLNGKRVEVKRAIPQDRMSGEDGGAGGALDGFPPHMRGMPRLPNGFGAGVPGMDLPGLHGAANGQLTGGMRDRDGLDAALSTANSVLNAAQAEPSSTSAVSNTPISSSLLNNAFCSGSNFASATAALSSGMRAGYGGAEGGSQGPEDNSSSQAPPPNNSNSSPNNDTIQQMIDTQQTSMSNTLNVQLQAQQQQAAQQQQGIQGLQLQLQQQQLQQQQILINQLQQQQRQNQIAQMQQLQELQRQLQPGSEKEESTPGAAGAECGLSQQSSPAAAAGELPSTTTIGASTIGTTTGLEESLKMLAVENGRQGGGSTLPSNVQIAAGGPLPGFLPPSSGDTSNFA